MEVKILTSLCRICLNDNALVPIFTSPPSEQISDKIMACAAVHVAAGDPLPTQICKQCHKALEIAFLFKTKCEQMDRQLRKVIQDQTMLLNKTYDVNSPIKYSSVQICIEPSTKPLFTDFDQLQLIPKQQESIDQLQEGTPVIPSNNENLPESDPKSNELGQVKFIRTTDNKRIQRNVDIDVNKLPSQMTDFNYKSHQRDDNLPLITFTSLTDVEKKDDVLKIINSDELKPEITGNVDEIESLAESSRTPASLECAENTFNDESSNDINISNSQDNSSDSVQIELSNFNNLTSMKIFNTSDKEVIDVPVTCTDTIDKLIDPLLAPLMSVPSPTTASADNVSVENENAQVDNTNNIAQQPNGDIVMYFDNDQIHLGEECEVITDDLCQRDKIYPTNMETNLDLHSLPSARTTPEQCPIGLPTTLPKGRYVVIKSVIKPQNIHYVTVDNFRKNEEIKKLIPIKQVENTIKKEVMDVPLIKNEVPEPASYIETETSSLNNEPLINLETGSLDNDFLVNSSSNYKFLLNSDLPSIKRPSSPPKSVSSIRTEEKPRGRGRPRKCDKYKPPQGVSYLKSGKKNQPILVRSRKLKRTRYSRLRNSEIIDLDHDGSHNIITKCSPVIKRARVEKIVPYKISEENKFEFPKSSLSTTLLSSDKLLKKLNQPQKQVLYQRLKLQNYRPTSKKDISERGIPEPLFVVSPTLTEEEEDDDPPKIRPIIKKYKKRGKYKKSNSISEDLAIIRSSNKKLHMRNSDKKLQTIDQDLKMINSDVTPVNVASPSRIKKEKCDPLTDSTENNVIESTKSDSTANSKMIETILPAKTGRHTAIKSKRPQKRNRLISDSFSNPQKVEIELKIVPRKSERQRSPKKIFPEIDIFTSPKRKIIEIPISENSSAKEDDKTDYEIEKTEHNHNKFKIRIKGRNTNQNSLEENTENEAPIYLKTENEIDCNYYNEIEVETENRLEKRSTDLGITAEDSDSDFNVENCSSDDSSSKNYQHSNASIVHRILEKERIKLDYGAGLSCNVCNKSFPYRSHLIRHVRTHTGLKPYSCEYCKKNFTSLSSLNIHVKNHVGDHPYSCEVCGRGFVQPSVLKRHMLSHTGEHPFQCEICYKTFVHDSSLKTHLKMHTVKEPQHKCDICEKKFKYLSTLTSHLKTHSGIKPFTCPECRKAFYRRSLLARHMRSHTKERPYKCKLCKARFAYSGGLASHRKLHTGIRPYECEFCEFTFFRSSHLKNHMIKIHNNGVLLECQKCNMQFDSKPLFRQHLSLHIKREPVVDYDAEV